ncbi:MAG TPA: glycosyltransferase family 4 protein [Candidatus Thermoplasmatota archaeon]|nr:glycosyltransferase family 4 protein [Candidatus Thermoplasmatota archaeon]
MRVLTLAVRFPPATGGAETHAHAVASGLAARGHEVEVWTTDLRSERPLQRLPAADEPTAPFRVRRFRAHALPGEAHYVWWDGLLRELLARVRGFDVVHAHSYGYYHSVAAALAAPARGVPFVLTPHYHPPWSVMGGARRRRLRGLFDQAVGPWHVSRADRVIHVSRAEREAMAPLGLAPGRSVVIPNGIDVAALRRADDGGARFRERVGLRGKEPLIVFAGRLAQNKRVEDLLAGAAKLPDARVALVGPDAGARAFLSARARELLVSDRVLFAGELPYEVYVSALSAADVFVLPSEYEAFGIVLLEAMAVGTPVVATRVGGVPEVVVDGRDGLLVPPGEPSALAEAIARLLSDRPRAEAMARAGRAKAEGFDWSRIVERTERVLADLR